jgi:fatty acid desaturase
VKVGPVLRLLYGGLDDHVDHHVYPWIPSRNLPKLHRLMKENLPEPRGMIDCWREMFAIAREKDLRSDHEYVPCPEVLFPLNPVASDAG